MRALFLILAVIPLISGYEGLSKGRPFPDSWYDGTYIHNEGNDLENEAGSMWGGSERLIGTDEQESLNANHKIKNYGDMDCLDWAKSLGATLYVKAAKLSGFENEVRKTRPITAFVPTNKAFAKLPKAYLAYFAMHPDRLRKTLEYHTLNEGRNTSTLEDEQSIPTLFRNLTARFNIYPHAGRENISTIMGARLTDRVDVRASNGMVHLLEDVILHFQIVDAYEAISKCPRFRTLFTALVVADMASELKDEKPDTLFAPTEEAFARLPAGCWEALLKNKTALTEVLEYHIGELGTYFSRGWMDGESIPSALEGQNLTITITGDNAECMSRSGCRGRFRVNNVEITYANVAVTNGIIHVIDRILVPKHIAHDLGIEESH